MWFHNFKSKLLNQYFGIEKRFYIGWKRWTGFVKRVSFQTFNLSCRWYILSDCLRFLWTGVLALDVLRCLSSLTRASNTLSIITSDESEFRIFLAEQSALFTSGPKIYLKLHKNWHEWTFLQVFFSTGFLLFSRLSVVPTKLYIPCIKPFQASDIIHCRIYRVIQSDSHKWICYFMTLYPCLIDF